jgi:hypothetical protein
MGKAKNFTYVIGLEGGAEEGPLTLADLKPRLRDGKIVGSTFVKRSDRNEWATAADLPELKVKDVVEGKDPFGPDDVTIEIAKELELRKVRSGVSWLFWVGALSLINSGLAIFGINRTYAMGLGVAHLIAALGDHLSATAVWISLGANVGLSFGFIVVGALAYHNRHWLLGPAIAVYIADAILCALFELWLSVGLHALALFFLIPGFIASFGARGIEIKPRVWITQGITALLLSGAAFGSVKFLEDAATPEPTKWSVSAPDKWPQLSLANAAEFKGHTHMKAGNTFFINTRSGGVVAGTARHLLGSAGGVEPALKLSEFDSNLKQWRVTARGSANSARIVGLHGSHENYPVLFDWVLFKVAPEDIAKLPAEPLSPRLNLVEEDEVVYLVGAGVAGSKQEIHRAKVVEADVMSINAKLDKPIDLTGFSGAPVIDANGSLIGVLTSSRSVADKNGRFKTFVAESVIEVKNLLR